MPPGFDTFDWQPPTQHHHNTPPSPTSTTPLQRHYHGDDDPHTAEESGITNRAELILRIKAGETPAWIPVNRKVSNKPNSSFYDQKPYRDQSDRYNANHTSTTRPLPISGSSPSHPYSALHQGIFTPWQQQLPPNTPPPAAPFSRFSFASPTESTALNTSSPLPPAVPAAPSSPLHRPHTRALSLSNFIFKPPTSPLAHSTATATDSHDDGSKSPTPTTLPTAIPFPTLASRRKSLPIATLQYSPSSSSIPNYTPPSSLHRRTSTTPSASLLGSYEESILRGHMSTPPSLPLPFIAQIGVLGHGSKCKPSLRCPPHVTLPFPAYFYNVGDCDSPSPYVGQIDFSANGPRIGGGGAYRIPQKGQLQIVIKNANKTAVKLFLVPYDLKGMEAGTKTFVRQKSYSIGGGVGRTGGPGEKDTLRYCIHLQIVCPMRGRYYLFERIRVVFANRVPDGKEKLRNEVVWQVPKFAAWRGVVDGPAAVIERRRSLKREQQKSSGTLESQTLPAMGFGRMIGVSLGGEVTSTEEPGEKMEWTKRQPASWATAERQQGLLARRLKKLEVDEERMETSGRERNSEGVGRMRG